MKKIEKYLALVTVNFRSERVYFANWVARFASIALRLWIFAQLYRATYASIGAKSVGGLTLSQVIWVLALTQCFGVVTAASTEKIVSEEVRSGDIAYHLSRPCSYIMLHYFTFIGKGLSFLLESIAAGFLVSYILIGAPDLSAQGALAGALLLLGGATLHFLITMGIGLIAFWTEDISAFYWIYHKLYIILGGMLIPPELYTPFWREIAEMLPFSKLFYAGARASAAFNAEIFLKDAMLLSAWLLMLLLVVNIMYRTGSKRVSTNGG